MAHLGKSRNAGKALLVVGIFGLAAVGAGLWTDLGPDPGPSGHRTAASAPTWRTTPSTSRDRPVHAPSTSVAAEPIDNACPCPNLLPGSDPAALPGSVLIADHLNNRLVIVAPDGRIVWEFPRPGDLLPGQTFLAPDDAFFTPDGKNILVTEEDDFVISLVSVSEHRILWRYGTPGVPGSGPNLLWNPDDAMMMPDGNIILADIKNCRLLVLRPALPQPVRVYGTTTNACWHQPPGHWGSPNGAFPMGNGDYLITEINGDWVDGLTLTGQVTFAVHPPGVAYPSDTNEVRPGVYLTADYSQPGQIEEFDQAGRLLWRYAPSGPDALDQPSLALPLPNGDILANDDFSHRVVVIDPRNDTVVWQYGHTGIHGTADGYLYDPDGVDLVPPNSLTSAHAATMGNYPLPAHAGPVPGQAAASPESKR
jgi:DNA-binding beta-propeller fold protein YncE